MNKINVRGNKRSALEQSMTTFSSPKSQFRRMVRGVLDLAQPAIASTSYNWKRDLWRRRWILCLLQFSSLSLLYHACPCKYRTRRYLYTYLAVGRTVIKLFCGISLFREMLLQSSAGPSLTSTRFESSWWAEHIQSLNCHSQRNYTIACPVMRQALP